MDWLENIQIEDLPDDYREVAETAGLECAIKLSDILGGRQFYFPKLDALIAKKKAEYIWEKFNGANHAELARATGCSERWVYEILKNKREEKQGLLL
jgi:Mor family transcriptional regulator